MADKTTKLSPIAEEFCPNFNVYLNNGTKALHIKLQHPTPTIDGLGTPRHASHQTHDDLRSLAAQMLQGNNTKVPEQASTQPPPEVFFKPANEESKATKTAVQQIKKDALWKPLIR